MNTLSSPLIFGEVLFDSFPDGSRVLGGAPFNVAWHCQAFGLSPRLVTAIGDDDPGQQIISAMHEWGMDTSAVQIDTDHATGMVTVHIENGEPSYDIVQDSAWDFINANKLPMLSADGWLYHGSLALRQQTSAHALQQLIRAGRARFVDINLRPPWWQAEQVLDLLEQVQLLKLNEDELMQLHPQAASTEQAMQQLLNERAIEQLVVTRGEHGVMACTEQGDSLQIAPQQKAEVIDTVGAGDAFSSVLLLGQHRGWSLQDSLHRAQAFAAAIVGIRGATINDRDFYQPFLADWGL